MNIYRYMDIFFVYNYIRLYMFVYIYIYSYMKNFLSGHFIYTYIFNYIKKRKKNVDNIQYLNFITKKKFITKFVRELLNCSI